MKIHCAGNPGGFLDPGVVPPQVWGFSSLVFKSCPYLSCPFPTPGPHSLHWTLASGPAMAFRFLHSLSFSKKFPVTCLLVSARLCPVCRRIPQVKFSGQFVFFNDVFKFLKSFLCMLKSSLCPQIALVMVGRVSLRGI